MKIILNEFGKRLPSNTHILIDDKNRYILAGDFEQVTRVMNYIMERQNEDCL